VDSGEERGQGVVSRRWRRRDSSYGKKGYQCQAARSIINSKAPRNHSKTYMTVRDPSWTLSSLKSLDQQGSTRDGRRIVYARGRGSAWIIRDGPFTKLSSQALLGEPSQGRRDGGRLRRLQRVGLVRTALVVGFEVVLEDGHVGCVKEEPQLKTGLWFSNIRLVKTEGLAAKRHLPLPRRRRRLEGLLEDAKELCYQTASEVRSEPCASLVG
jgi:hypothetical protein